MLSRAAHTAPTVCPADVDAAAQRIFSRIAQTPCLHSLKLSKLTGAEIYVKFENCQFTASFKERGALNFLLQLDADERRRGVITMSAGNHGQAIAYHASRLAIPAVIVMPLHTPYVKVEQTRSHGAEVMLHGETLEDAFARASELARKKGLTLVHPYDDPAVIAGQGTVALEMLAAHPAIDSLIVPVGGGGLISGVALAAGACKPGIEIIGVQTASFPSMLAAINGSTPVCGGNTIAEGIAVKAAGLLTRELVCRLVADIVLVDESQLERAITMLLNDEKTVAEGAGAAGLAAVLADPARFHGRKVGIVVTGGNIDPNLLASVIVRDLVRQKRIVSMRLTMPDRPGYLARISQTISDLGANVLEVDHRRLSVTLPARSATLELTIESRNARHAEEVIAAITAAGFDPVILPP
jgi:threonine dehydratase